MQLWRRLYNTVWLAFFACVLLSRWMGSMVGVPVHALLGIALLVATWSNVRSLAVLPVPPRLKRISRAAAGFALFQLIVGLALGAVAHFAADLAILSGILLGAHVVGALAILAQSSSLATGYDMWEEKEFGETRSMEGSGTRQWMYEVRAPGASVNGSYMEEDRVVYGKRMGEQIG